MEEGIDAQDKAQNSHHDVAQPLTGFMPLLFSTNSHGQSDGALKQEPYSQHIDDGGAGHKLESGDEEDSQASCQAQDAKEKAGIKGFLGDTPQDSTKAVDDQKDNEEVVGLPEGHEGCGGQQHTAKRHQKTKNKK